MNKSVIAPRKRRGVALIICVSILALLSIIATGFVLNMEFELKATANYGDGVKAQNAAEAGIKLAIARLKTLARTTLLATPTSPNDWNYISTAQPSFDNSDGTSNNSTSVLSLDLGRGSIGVCSLRVVDTASQININDTNPRLGTMLENLVAIIGAPLAVGDGDAIVANRPAGGYTTKEEIMLRAAFTQAKYNAIRGFITVNSYIDQNSEDTAYDSTYQPKAPVNINTASAQVLEAVLRSILDFAQDVRAQVLAAAIVGARPFADWQQFDTFIDSNPGGVGLTVPEMSGIKNNANPNRVKPADYTTDFCFHPSGYYEITSTGKVGIDANTDGDLADAGDVVNAENSITAIAKIYEILYYTTKEQFRGEDVNYNGILNAGEDINGNGILDVPTYQRVTWMNSCPVNASSLFGQDVAPSSMSPEYVYAALKIGFWDNFDESSDFSNSQWTGNAHELSDEDGDGDFEMWTDARWPNFTLSNAARWTWTFSKIRIHERDRQWEWGWRDAGWVQCNGISIFLARDLSPLEWGGTWYRNVAGVCMPSGDPSWPLWYFPSRLARLPGTVYGDGTMPYTVDTLYTSQKTYNITHASGGFGATVYNGPFTASITYPSGGASILNLYSSANKPAWDDVRIIPTDGNYISPTYRPLGAGNNVEWGTMGFTGTLQTGTTINTYASLGGGAFNPVSLNGPIGATSADSIRYRANFTSDSTMQNTPILEDITITYLPSTKILYWR